MSKDQVIVEEFDIGGNRYRIILGEDDDKYNVVIVKNYNPKFIMKADSIGGPKATLDDARSEIFVHAYKSTKTLLNEANRDFHRLLVISNRLGTDKEDFFNLAKFMVEDGS